MVVKKCRRQNLFTLFCELFHHRIQIYHKLQCPAVKRHIKLPLHISCLVVDYFYQCLVFINICIHSVYLSSKIHLGIIFQFNIQSFKIIPFTETLLEKTRLKVACCKLFWKYKHCKFCHSYNLFKLILWLIAFFKYTVFFGNHVFVYSLVNQWEQIILLHLCNHFIPWLCISEAFFKHIMHQSTYIRHSQWMYLSFPHSKPIAYKMLKRTFIVVFKPCHTYT